MSEIGRYRKLYPRIWLHPEFRKLTTPARELALYLLTGNQTNRIGLFRLSIATAAEDLDATSEAIRERIADVCGAFEWQFDPTARVFYIPSWWKWNQPENVRVLKGNLKDLSEIPPSFLMAAFARNLATIANATEKCKDGTVTLHETFAEECRKRIPEHSPTQEHYQEHFRTGAGTPKNFPSAINDELRSIARRAIDMSEPGAEIDYLADLVSQISGQVAGRVYPRADVVAAISALVSEARPS